MCLKAPSPKSTSPSPDPVGLVGSTLTPTCSFACFLPSVRKAPAPPNVGLPTQVVESERMQKDTPVDARIQGRPDGPVQEGPLPPPSARCIEAHPDAPPRVTSVTRGDRVLGSPFAAVPSKGLDLMRRRPLSRMEDGSIRSDVECNAFGCSSNDRDRRLPGRLPSRRPISRISGPVLSPRPFSHIISEVGVLLLGIYGLADHIARPRLREEVVVGSAAV